MELKPEELHSMSRWRKISQQLRQRINYPKRRKSKKYAVETEIKERENFMAELVNRTKYR